MRVNALAWPGEVIGSGPPRQPPTQQKRADPRTVRCLSYNSLNVKAEFDNYICGERSTAKGNRVTNTGRRHPCRGKRIRSSEDNGVSILR